MNGELSSRHWASQMERTHKGNVTYVTVRRQGKIPASSSEWEVVLGEWEGFREVYNAMVEEAMAIVALVHLDDGSAIGKGMLRRRKCD